MGPFYVQNPPEAEFGADIRGGANGERLFMEGTIRSVDGTPVANAIVDVWHSDAEGFYDVQLPELEEPDAAGALPQRCAGPLPFLDHHAEVLSDPGRWHGGRDVEGVGAASLTGRRTCIS